MNYLTKTIQGYIKPNQTTKQQLNLVSKGCNFVYNLGGSSLAKLIKKRI